MYNFDKNSFVSGGYVLRFANMEQMRRFVGELGAVLLDTIGESDPPYSSAATTREKLKLLAGGDSGETDNTALTGTGQTVSFTGLDQSMHGLVCCRIPPQLTAAASGSFS